jgi:hypothetical protein
MLNVGGELRRAIGGRQYASGKREDVALNPLGRHSMNAFRLTSQKSFCQRPLQRRGLFPGEKR